MKSSIKLLESPKDIKPIDFVKYHPKKKEESKKIDCFSKKEEDAYDEFEYWHKYYGYD